MPRVSVTKTYKLYIGGAFPRSESGRSLPVADGRGETVARVCHASRKDLRQAVEAARAGLPAWAGATALLRGQVLYRMAEMLEGRRGEMVEALATTAGLTRAGGRREVDAAVDRLVCFSGWADKFQQVLGGQNPVAAPFYNITTPEPTGVVAVVCPDAPALLGMVTLLAPPLAAGGTVVVIAGDRHPVPAALFAEVLATSDLPAGAANLLTGRRRELLEHVAGHRGIDAVSAAGLPARDAAALERGRAENIKRVHVIRRTGEAWFDADECESPWTIEPFVEMKTVWHPARV